MALIKCKSCGHMISDKAHKCPKCGHYNDETPTSGIERGKGNKTMYTILAIAIVAIIAGTVVFVIKHKNEVARLEAANLAQQARIDSIAAAEQARIAEQYRRDSIYANFTSPDLNTFQVKGYVKSISMKMLDVSWDLSQYIELQFDTAGIVTNASTTLQYNSSPTRLNLSITRDGKYIKGLSFASKYDGSGSLSFGYDEGMLNKFKYTYESKNSDCYDMRRVDIEYSAFNDHGLPTTINFHDAICGFGAGMMASSYTTYSTYETKINYTQIDNNGNWTELSLSGTKISRTKDGITGDISEAHPSSFSTIVTRAITYYTPEEIFGKDTIEDFTPKGDAISKDGTMESGPSSASIIKEYDKISVKAYRYKGTIGDNKIEVELKIYGKNAAMVIGKYRYLRDNGPGHWLGLKGTRGGLDGSNELKEYNASGKCTGIWEFSERSLGGLFTLYDGNTYDLFLDPMN